MAKKRYKVDILSPSSINQLKKNLQAYRDGLQGKCYTLVQRLAEKGVEISKAYIQRLDAVFTGELHNSMKSEMILNSPERVVFAVVADSTHAVFVEFGTGMVGKDKPYPVKFPEGVDWQYATGKTIRQLSDGRYGWFYERDGQWYFTEGMPSRPFMHYTSLELMREIVKTAREVFA